MRKSGIYKISNCISGSIYVGSAIDLDIRKNKHFYMLAQNKHCNQILQRAYNKYGKDTFEFSVIESCSLDDLVKREQYYIDLLQPKYNICKFAGNSLGYKHTEETRVKMQQRKREYFKNNISWSKGRKVPEESRQKMSLAKKGITPWNKGIPRTAEEKLKFSIANRGAKNPRSKKVTQFNKDGSIVKTWESLRQAATTLGFAYSGIKAACKGLQTHSHGFIWKYLNN